MNSKIWLSSPHMGGEELNFVNEAFAANWIAPLGPNVDGFEAELSGITGVKHVAALSSGTAALHLALILAGVGREDEVICQSMTFSASANPIMYVGALPVFVDSEKDTWNMDPALLEDAILDRIKQGKKPKAIIVVHLYGMPAKMDEILTIARKYEIALIEDAAEALGSSYKGTACGAFGDYGILSFNGNKIITTSGGGALISNDENAVKHARFLATQARDNAPHYQHSHVGYNYRMSNICAGIGRGQLKVLDERVKQRRANKAYYSEVLGPLPGVSFLEEVEGSFSNFWLTTLVIDPTVSKGVTREQIRLALDADNIESRPLWKPMHLQPVFTGAPAYVNGNSESLFNTGLCLPSGSNLTRADLERVTNIVTNLFD
ncbi:DegT/DnrJ/EryC1/StrS family aminotransferase [Chitinophaga sancti]|uniref:GDP-perosamine synthase n=1 Tax=Chitinophaga sancti TaxID=1004 RepID=A0A1K1MRW9_9BACT|nr:DegT/DnrJ/EryC1/StrS family aminotransferase [Chitinophaga sancti]WQD62930.1 aminotransferase class I/II-fold pyridoxal phosphate-dependent enzyme [Chitinophaga sancti]WQG91445.1 aminotransferase class I/II-fold pyridoxal phosphate-dependent enzyme [Chitinophaga sancti]SFW25940.1 DegT/DnrJ/EryC1/StrS aminotransferase family protein [Chitinophaga sancti]